MNPTYVQGLREAKALDKESQERKKAAGVGAQRCLASEHRDILGDSQAMVHEREPT